ncbi:carbon-nitrogen hydrolase family protein [Sphingomonas flavalba]|uniref:carbon-nitrogen hydrolase family protein n=1 Tax=Sphingomonas flavalba TaxID=2559804 RepID=UPI0039DF343C
MFTAAAVQAAPEYLDLGKGVDKAIALIEEAARKGAQLIGFPECWIPGYPFWAWLDSPAATMRYVGIHASNCMTVDGPEVQRIAAAARANRIWVVLGFSERSGGSLYIAQLIIADDGTVVAARRKLKATLIERTIFGEGDGSDIKVHDTALGKLGALCCWEHVNPLTKYAMFAQHEQVHVGSWPSFSLYPDKAYALGPEVNGALSRVYAVEGQCFVIAPCAVISPAMIEQLCDTPVKAELLHAGGGHAMIWGPDGRPLATPLAPDEEGLVLAEIDLGMIPFAKAGGDPVGHYSRPDVMRLLFNPAPTVCVEWGETAGRAGRMPNRPADTGATEQSASPAPEMQEGSE